MLYLAIFARDGSALVYRAGTLGADAVNFTVASSTLESGVAPDGSEESPGRQAARSHERSHAPSPPHRVTGKVDSISGSEDEEIGFPILGIRR
tara:strand:- start:31 stop:309 length:279 start_codon:yes stop_codon:yes gene_type:complete